MRAHTMPNKKSMKSEQKRLPLMEDATIPVILPIQATVLPIESSRAPTCSLPPLITLPEVDAFASTSTATTTTTTTAANTHTNNATTTTTTNTNNKRKRSAATANLPLDETLTEYDLELTEFECPRCDLRFASTVLLFEHMRIGHDNPTVCHVCHKDLKAMPNILSHSYLEKGIKPYKCPKPGCDYSCRTRFNIKTHLASCAGIQKFRYHRPSKRPRLSSANGNNGNGTGNGNNAGNHRKSNRNKKGQQQQLQQQQQQQPDSFFVQSGSAYHRAGNVYDYSRENLFNMKSMKNAKNGIMRELKDSGLADANRDTQYLVIIHADYVPGKLGTFPLL